MKNRPAAIFSEEGLKMFIEALTGIAVERPVNTSIFDHNFEVVETPEREEEPQVDTFLNDWKAYKQSNNETSDEHKKKIVRKREPGYTTPRKTFEESRIEYERLAAFLNGYSGPVPLKEIHAHLFEMEVWDFPQKQASSRIGYLNKHFGGIEKAGLGLYQMRGENKNVKA